MEEDDGAPSGRSSPPTPKKVKLESEEQKQLLKAEDQSADESEEIENDDEEEDGSPQSPPLLDMFDLPLSSPLPPTPPLPSSPRDFNMEQQDSEDEGPPPGWDNTYQLKEQVEQMLTPAAVSAISSDIKMEDVQQDARNVDGAAPELVASDIKVAEHDSEDEGPPPGWDSKCQPESELQVASPTVTPSDIKMENVQQDGRNGEGAAPELFASDIKVEEEDSEDEGPPPGWDSKCLPETELQVACPTITQSDMASSSSRPRGRKRPATSQPGAEPAVQGERPPSPPPVRPDWLTRHPYMEFPAPLATMSVARIYGHLSRFQDREFAVISSVDVSLEETRFLFERIARHTERVRTLPGPGGEVTYTDHSFGRLVEISEPVYPVLCQEFLSTFLCDVHAQDFDRVGYVSYRLGGVFHSCSFLQFARDLRLYTQAEIDDPLLLTHLRTARLLEDDGFSEAAFWSEVGRGAHAAEVTVSRLRDPRYRFLARLIICYLQQRPSADKLNRRDLYFLWCFHHGHPLAFARILASQLLTRGGLLRGGSPVLGGHLVTVLARTHRVDLTGLTLLRPRLFTASAMRTCRLVERLGDTLVLPVVVAPQQVGADAPGVAVPDAPPPPQPQPQPQSQPRVTVAQVAEQLGQVQIAQRQTIAELQWMRGVMTALCERFEIPLPPFPLPPPQPQQPPHAQQPQPPQQ